MHGEFLEIQVLCFVGHSFLLKIVLWLKDNDGFMTQVDGKNQLTRGNQPSSQPTQSILAGHYFGNFLERASNMALVQGVAKIHGTYANNYLVP